MPELNDTRKESDERLIARIRKLLAFTNTNATEGEVENAIRLARKLMEENDLAEADVLAKAETSPDVVEEILDNKFNILRQLVCMVACQVCSTQCYREGNTLKIFGYPRDIAVARALTRDLWVTMRTMCNAKFPSEAWGANMYSYCYGFGCGMLEKAKGYKAQPIGASQAIVLVRDAKMDDWFKSKNLNFVPLPGNEQLNEQYSVGMRDGREVDVGAERKVEK